MGKYGNKQSAAICTLLKLQRRFDEGDLYLGLSSFALSSSCYSSLSNVFTQESLAVNLSLPEVSFLLIPHWQPLRDPEKRLFNSR